MEKRGVYFLLVLVVIFAVGGNYYYPEGIGFAPSFVVTNDPQCEDGFDNDGDGNVDFPEDLECFAPWDISEDNNLGCDEDWSCTQWSACLDKIQERVCIDDNECGTEDQIPENERDCDLFFDELGKEDSGKVYVYIAVGILLILIVFLIVNRFGASRDRVKIGERKKILRERLRRKEQRKIYVGR